MQTPTLQHFNSLATKGIYQISFPESKDKYAHLGFFFSLGLAQCYWKSLCKSPCAEPTFTRFQFPAEATTAAMKINKAIVPERKAMETTALLCNKYIHWHQEKKLYCINLCHRHLSLLIIREQMCKSNLLFGQEGIIWIVINSWPPNLRRLLPVLKHEAAI